MEIKERYNCSVSQVKSLNSGVAENVCISDTRCLHILGKVRRPMSKDE